MLKKLLKNVKGYALHTVLSPLLIMGEVAMEVVIPVLIALLIDDGIGKGDMGFILKTGAAIAACAVVSLIFGAFAGRSSAIASTGFAYNLRKNMFSRISGFSFKNIDKFSSSGLITRMTTDVQRLQDSFQMIIRIAFRAPAMIIFSLIMAFGVNSELAFVFVGAVPILVVGIGIIMSKAHPIFKRMFKKFDSLNRVVQENLRGIRVVKAFVREDEEIKKFNAVSEDIKNESVRAEKLLAFSMPMMQTVVYACILVICWLGANIIVKSGGTEMTTGDLTALLNYTSQILMNLMMLSMIFINIVMSRASAERVCEILSEESTVKNPDSPIFEVPDGSIEFCDVAFAYHDGKDVLQGINLSIASGETVGIIGSTGSAKSSLVQLIPRLYDVTEGKVKVGGIDVKDYDLHTLRDCVAMVLQKNVLFSGTVKDNLRWGNENATDEEMKAACVSACADEFVSAFPNGYDTHIEQGGSNVSGGQKQRLCIARALLKKPKILIMDDSTSAVDTKTDSLLRREMSKNIPGVTKLIIAQRISSVCECDRIIVIDNGRIDGVGTHEELLASNTVYREVYESQTKGDSEE